MSDNFKRMIERAKAAGEEAKKRLEADPDYGVRAMEQALERMKLRNAPPKLIADMEKTIATLKKLHAQRKDRTRRRPEQVETKAVSYHEIVYNPAFARGVQSALAGEPPDYDSEPSWAYERGRMFVAACRARGLRIPKVPSRNAVSLYSKLHEVL